MPVMETLTLVLHHFISYLPLALIGCDGLGPDIPLSVGIVDPRAHPLQLNTLEFLWDPVKNASVFIQVPPPDVEPSL